MIAAQLIAAHNAAMECHRRAMLGEQTFEGRRENLAQANKLSRTYATLLDALNRHRGKGQQKVTVEHVHVHAGGQAVVGMVETPGEGDRPKSEDQPMQSRLPMHLSLRCGARTRSGSPCRSPAMPNGRCRMHRGPSPGAPRGNKYALKHGRYTAEAIANRREIATLLRKMNALARDYGLSHAEAHSGGRLPFCLPRPAYLIGPQTSWHQRQEAIQRLADGVAQADVARTYGVSQATISRLAAPSPFGVGAAAAL